MKMSEMSDILNDFKRLCKLKGWTVSESEDWVELNNEYHNFLFTRNVTPSSFKKIISNRKCVVRKGSLYSVVEPSHLAWLFSETPKEDLVKTVLESPDFSERIAIFDLSSLLEGKNLCARLNNTGSAIFREFEKFLQSELKVKLENFHVSSSSNIEAATNVLHEVA